MKKTKVAKRVQVGKTPKVLKDPDIYKDVHISWQLNRIDEGSRWGISVFRENIRLVKNDRLFDGFDNLNDDLSSAVIDFLGEEFDSIDSYLEKLHEKADGNISSDDIKVILKSVDENIFWKDIYPTLVHFEKKTWFDIEKETYFGRGRNKTKHHAVEISRLISEAQRRLQELKMDDIDELFSIRLSGKIRIWGIRKHSYFQVLWFDLHHEICPSKK